MLEAISEMTIADSKSLLSTASDRASTYHRLFNEDPRKNATMGKLALEHETAIIKATGNWKERFDLDLTVRPGLPLPPAEQADSDWLQALPDAEQVFPGITAWWMDYASQKLTAEQDAEKAEGPPVEAPRLIGAEDSD